MLLPASRQNINGTLAAFNQIVCVCVCAKGDSMYACKSSKWVELLRFHRSLFLATFILVLTVPIIESCDNARSSKHLRSKEILVDRQVVITDFGGNVNSVSALEDGNLVVTGSSGTAWVVTTNSSGEIKWTYREPADADFKNPFQSNLTSAVSLENGRVLVCGNMTTNKRRGIALIFDGHGSLVERKEVLPTDTRDFVSSSIGTCFRWGMGIGIVGTSSNNLEAATWLKQLDSNGNEKSLIWLNTPVATTPVELSDHSLILSRLNTDSFEVKLAVFDEKGNCLSTRSIPGYSYLQMRSVSKSNSTAIVSYGAGNVGTLFTLGERLQDLEPPRRIGTFEAQRGRGYFLDDHSLVLFGRSDNAAIAWLSGWGLDDKVVTLDRAHASYVISDATPISANRFVAVRNSVGPDTDWRGLVLSWITFRQ